MKKIIFTLMLLVGGFVAQAQDTLIVTNFTSSDGSFLHIADDYEACYGNYTDVSTTKYTRASDGNSYIRDINGVTTTVTIPSFVKADYTALFASTYAFIREVNSNGSQVLFVPTFDSQAKN